MYPDPAAGEKFAEALKEYKTNKGTIRIPYGEVDAELKKGLPCGATKPETMHEEQYHEADKRNHSKYNRRRTKIQVMETKNHGE